jgi:hypothetical protein
VRVGIVSVFTDYHRRGAHHRGALQPQAGPLIAALLPPEVEVDVINDAWDDPPWERDYDLLFLSALHADFDRARQISHYYRRRGARTVLGGPLASGFPEQCAPWFDAIAIGDAEGTVPQLVRDLCDGRLAPLYAPRRYDPHAVPTPRFDLVREDALVPISLEATRGCPFACSFCTLTGLGTRHHVRPVELVVRDIRAAQAMLAGRVPEWKRRLVGFMDNNIGGDPRWLAALCEALAPLDIRWSSCVTFNVLRDEAMLDRLAASGCGMLYFGLETFNDAALAGMRKRQNVVDDVRRVLAAARRRGILVTAGLMLSPGIDRLEDVARIPHALRDVGLHVPTYIAFETPLPGTPHFRALAARGAGALLPQVPLVDLNGYTLAVPPTHAGVEEFVGAYRDVHRSVFSLRNGLRKLAEDLPTLVAGRHFAPALLDLYEVLFDRQPLPSDRTFVAGRDKAPPERVPLVDADFASEAERDAVLATTFVSDADGCVAAEWARDSVVFGPKGRVLPIAAAAMPGGRVSASRRSAAVGAASRLPPPLGARSET